MQIQRLLELEFYSHLFWGSEYLKFPKVLKVSTLYQRVLHHYCFQYHRCSMYPKVFQRATLLSPRDLRCQCWTKTLLPVKWRRLSTKRRRNQRSQSWQSLFGLYYAENLDIGRALEWSAYYRQGLLEIGLFQVGQGWLVNQEGRPSKIF